MRTVIIESNAAQKGLARVPCEVASSYEIWARLVEEHGLAVLRDFKGYHDEKLQGAWHGHRSSRLNRKWRVVYKVDTSGKVQIVTVVRVTPHDYRSTR